MLKVAGTVKDSIVDGPGLRFTLFVQGCPHNCKGCHNPETHDFLGGKERSVEEIFDEILSDDGIAGVTFSGGEPFCQAKELARLAKMVKEKGLELAVYSGYTFEELISGKVPHANQLLEQADVLIDGRFDITKRSLEIAFRGSTNQRIIDLKKSLKLGAAVLSDDYSWVGKDINFSKDKYAPKDIRKMGR